MTFLSSSARRFHCLLDFLPWTNISWWFRNYGRTLLPTLQLDLFGLRKLVVTFRLLRLCALPCCKLHRSTSLLLFVLPTLRLDFYCILFYNYLCFLKLRSEFLVGNPLEGLFRLIVLFHQSSLCFGFTMCPDSPLPCNHDMTFIE